MKGSSDIVSAIQHLRMADDHMNSFILTHPGSKGAEVFKQYRARIKWILTSLKTHPFLPVQVLEGIRREIESDVFAVPAIAEKIALVPPDQREPLELLIDKVLSGEKINIINEDTTIVS